MFPQRAFLVNRLKEKRQEIESLLPNAPADKEIYTGWTLKELLAHMSGWDDVLIDALQAHKNDEPVSPSVTTGINNYNAKTVTTRKSLTFEQVIKEWETTRENLIHALENLPDEKFNQSLTFPWGEKGTVANLIGIFVEHEEFHGKHLEEWIENTDQPLGDH